MENAESTPLPREDVRRRVLADLLDEHFPERGVVTISEPLVGVQLLFCVEN